MTRNNDTTYRQRGRALALAAIMVLSVVGASIAIVGSATAVAADDVDSDDMPAESSDATVDADSVDNAGISSLVSSSINYHWFLPGSGLFR